MNWLAHIYLSDDSEEELLGNFLGDFLINTKWRTLYTPAVQKGIKMHFAVDKYTGLHPIFQRSCRRISEKNTMYDTILIDVFYDHFLAKNWPEFATSDLDHYVSSFYKVLLKNVDLLPDKLLTILPVLIQENWLVSYKDIRGIKQALARLSRRLSGSNTIQDGIIELENNYTTLETDFRAFLKELTEFICDFKKNELNNLP